MAKTTFSILLAVVMLTGSLFPSMEIVELTKLPALMEHFESHRAECPDLSFISFLKLHYNNAAHHQQDHHSHHKLPFTGHQQEHHFNCFHTAFIAPLLNTALSCPAVPEAPKATYQVFNIFSVSTTIWQPPKIARM